MSRRALTLFEILVVLAILAVVAGIFVQNWDRFGDHATLKADTDEVATQLLQARAEAIRLGVPVTVRVGETHVRSLHSPVLPRFRTSTQERLQEWPIPNRIEVELQDSVDGEFQFFPDGSADLARFRITLKRSQLSRKLHVEETGHISHRME